MPVSFVSNPPVVDAASGIVSIEFESGGETVSVALSRNAAFGLAHSLSRSIAELDAPGTVVNFSTSKGKDA
ncbi:hypothetical protein [Maricaulis sp.]|uniref:hypothetical protein n=1 Tax=Maricaulis sp. TaxID=1486257 RepID=UPI003A8DD497